MKLILETIDGEDVKKYIQSGYVHTGHGCWGESEGYSYKYVYLNGKKYEINNEYYIAHDGESILDVGKIDYLSNSLSEHLDPSIKYKHKKERYKRYLNLKKEFDTKSEENIVVIRDVEIENLTAGQTGN